MNSQNFPITYRSISCRNKTFNVFVPGTRRPPAPATSAPAPATSAPSPRFSKFARPPFSMNKAPDDGNQLGGAFGKLELDDSGKENASKIPEPLLKQVIHQVLVLHDVEPLIPSCNAVTNSH